jgi:hypothetical protein
MRRAYQTDLSDAEWSCLEPHLPAPRVDGRPRLHCLREILDATFYVLRSGRAWRLLPHDLEHRGRPSTTNLPILAFGWNVGEDARPMQARAGTSSEEPPA